MEHTECAKSVLASLCWIISGVETVELSLGTVASVWVRSFFYNIPLACCRVFYKHSAHVLHALPYGSVNKIPHGLSSDWTGADSPLHWRLLREKKRVRPTFLP